MADALKNTNPDEYYFRQGDPAKPTYYIFRGNRGLNGLFAYFQEIAGHIRYALSKGWLPVVDMQSHPNIYLPPEKVGKENAWEYYFEQPLRIGLEQAYSGENVIVRNALPPSPFFPRTGMSFFAEGSKELIEWRMLAELGLLKVKDALLKEVMALREKLFAPSDRVLGVLLRGTDYISKRPIGHCIPPF